MLRLQRALEAGGWSVAVAETSAGSGARPAVRSALDRGFTLLVACGGDGTLQEIAETTVSSVPAAGRPVLAAVPWGTANIFAHAMGCPCQPEAAARWLLRAQPTPRALGEVRFDSGDTRYFLSVASGGIDAAVVHELGIKAKRRWGKLAYAAKAWSLRHRYFPAPIALQVDGRDEADADGLIVSLTPFYGGRLRLTRAWPPRASALALALRGQPNTLGAQVARLLFSALDRAPGVSRLPCGPVRISTPGRPLELDGEAGGRTPAVIDVLPAGVRVLAAR